METFVHEFKSPINCYKALAVRHGLNAEPVAIYEGRMCYIVSSQRVRSAVGRSFYTSLQIKFIDDGSFARVPAAKFAKHAKTPPLPETDN